MTREGACMCKAILVVKVTREEMSVRLQDCSCWWEGYQIKSVRMFSNTFIGIWNSCQLSQVINKEFISYSYSSSKSMSKTRGP